MSEQTIPVTVFQINLEATDVVSLHLRRDDGLPLPPVDPGAHVDVFMPGDISRSYSLSNIPEDSGTYRLTIARDVNSQGGSIYLHDKLRVGEKLQISAQHNNFKLVEDAPFSVFIAGGIGITPFIPMISRLNETGQKWRLHYCVRTQSRAALLNDLAALAAEGKGEVLYNFDEEPGGSILDLKAALSDLPADTHAYCCGPVGMLDAYRAGAADAGMPDERVHYEYFASNIEKSDAGGYTVVCDRSDVNVVVKPGKTILQALSEAGLDVPSSCNEGICGSCETRVISGEPDHRDMILSRKERAENKKIIICCSGSKSDTLVLDV